MAKKNKLFSGKHYNPRGSAKRFQKKILPKIMDLENINDMSLEARRDFRAYLRERQKEISSELSNVTARSTITGKEALSSGLNTRKISDNPTELFKEFFQQNEFFSSIQIDYQAMKVKDEQFQEVVKDEEKWTILRRLALFDYRLNIDRSYASDVLREIENIIVQANDRNNPSKYQGKSYSEIADMLLSEYNESERYGFMKDWDEDMFEMDYDEDDTLFTGRRFHGRKRAEADKDRYTKWHNKQLSSYDPLYKDPTELLGKLVDLYD